MSAVGPHRELWVATKGFDFLNRNAVLLAFVPIAVVPGDSDDLRGHISEIV
jgi:hypothetical protein